MLRYNVHTDEFKSRISDLSEKPQYTLALGAQNTAESTGNGTEDNINV